jgi:Transcriptional regulatory protein, C terminal
MFPYNELILSDSALFTSTIKDNLPLEQNINTRFNAIDLECISLVVIDSHIKLEDIKYKIKTIINLTGIPAREDEIRFKKPIKLEQVLEIILRHRRSKLIFCKLTSNWIYDEQALTIMNHNSKVKLTARENKIFKFLLLNQNNKINKSDIIESLFRDSPWIGINNIEVYLNHLKNKLPEDCADVIRI